ncbi:hypothetical protein [Streptomyces bikiniensis]|uniref:hypothetical protein n=1 Tax=Streptomyces bikiniensis TaxID=1896 RepID=UPI000B1C89E5|nr:hypothetical protein [Streptomyces bikiniensis]
MNPPPPPGPLHPPALDPRVRGLVPDHAGMDALVAGLVLPGRASMYVMSALETSRELIRHSSYRYEFATVAVAHSLFALERVLAERLAADEPLRDLIERAADTGLVPAGIAAELDRARRLRDGLARGAVTSAALGPTGAAAMVRAVFDAVHLLLRPPSGASATALAEAAAADTDGVRQEGRLARLWEEHRRAPYPDGFRGVDIEGVELTLLDADVGGLVLRELDGGLDGDGVATLWTCIADLDKAVPLIDSAYCASYFTRLRTMAGLVAAGHLPAAS